MRFYPDSLPPYPCEPTGDRFEIRNIDERQGQGVVALQAFAAGEKLFVFTGFIVPEITQFSLQYKPGIHVHDPFFMGKVLHSCNPNAKCDMATLTFTALRDIQPGECITMDYEDTEDVLFKAFYCQCGSPNCKGQIRGRAFQPVEAELVSA